MSELRIAPWDEHNQTLVSQVHPPDWKNPIPRDCYDLVVIGAGTGGLITSLVASSLGARVALVERHLLGGDCLNVGCVPSKTLIRCAHQVHEARASGALGLGVPDDQLPDFGAVMRRVRAVRARISHEDSAQRYSEQFGVDVFLGEARFKAASRVEVDGTPLSYSRAVIATGARAMAPPVPGLAEAGHLDNETVFELTERPPRLAVIGAGPIGCEMAQAFHRLGSQVWLVERADQILIREDADAAGVVQEVLAREGVEMVLSADIHGVERRGAEKVIRFSQPGREGQELVVDEILVGAGRAPNVEGMGLEQAGVEFDPRRGVAVDDHLRTTNPRIWAVGDVCMAWKFTHAADAAAKIVVQNALFAIGPFGRKKLSDLAMPWCTYTSPEIAHVGLAEREAAEKSIEIDTYMASMKEANRAVTDGEEDGFVKVHVKKGGDRVLGATIVGARAGDLIPQLTLAIQHGIGLGAFSQLIYPYPTQGEAIKRAAGVYTRGRLTPMVARMLARWIAWRR